MASTDLINPQKKLKQDFTNHMDFVKLGEFTRTNTETIEFCQSVKLIPKKTNCPRCGVILETIKVAKRSVNSKHFRYRFICAKRACRKYVNALSKTFFENIHITIRKSLFLIYCFIKKLPIDTAIRQTSGDYFDNETTSANTVVDVYSFCREVCVESLVECDKFRKIGGRNFNVEIVEAKFGNSKYRRRVVEGQLFLVAICRETNDSFLVPVTDRTEETLLEIIKDRVEIGTIIHTDCFPSQLEYGHLTVNHTENFIDPNTGACTNKIVSTWWAVKRALPSNHTTKESFALHLAEYAWRRIHPDKESQFLDFVKDVCKLYPGL